MRTPTVSIVMIFLDAARFMREAVESILDQDYRDYELILVDDGSSDSSTQIAKNYAARFPDFVHYTEHEGHANRGMSASRNHGVAISRGRLITFLDSDDIWLPGRLSHFVAMAERFPEAGMVYGPTLYWYSWAKNDPREVDVPDHADFEGALNLPVETLICPPVALRGFLESGGGCLPGIGSLMIRREAFDSVGGFEPGFRGLYEDQVFLSKMTALHPVVALAELLDYYRQHSDSCCHRAIGTGDYHPDGPHPARAVYLRWLHGYLRQVGINDLALARALRTELWPYDSLVGRTFHGARRVSRDALQRYVPHPLRKQARLVTSKATRLGARVGHRLRRTLRWRPASPVLPRDEPPHQS